MFGLASLLACALLVCLLCPSSAQQAAASPSAPDPSALCRTWEMRRSYKAGGGGGGGDDADDASSSSPLKEALDGSVSVSLTSDSMAVFSTGETIRGVLPVGKA